MGKPKLYYIEISPASRAVLLTIRALNLDVELIPCNTLAGEHLKPEFLAINPQHCVPTLVDGANVVWDSHAICTYLATQHAQPGKPALCPIGDHYQRARLDQRLHYHHGTLFARYYASISPVFSKAALEFGTAAQLAAIGEALAFLECFLTGADYLVGDALTVADILCMTTVSSIGNVLQVDVAGTYPRVGEWLKRLAAELPGFEEIETRGVAKMRAVLLERVESNRKGQ